ncbi:hypothetical protein LCGC14_2011610 [marine sediment metagenome]|uniref:Uncharacterized protein n=1 Tax=marine sediment metagenome TaxID=412755 RepID=A0A0F9HDM0_9ZZZZ
MSGECDVNDIICQLETLKSLRSLKVNMGQEAMLDRFPQLSGMDEKLVESIQETEGDLKTAIRKCGNIDEEATLEMGEPVQSEEEKTAEEE